MKGLLLFLLLLYPFLIHADDEESQRTNINFSGSFRVRGTNVGRDVLLTRQTPVTPVVDPLGEYNSNLLRQGELISNDLERRRVGLPSQLTPRKEDINYYDTRFLYNMSFSAGKYVEGVWGMQVGDIPFGGKGLRATGPDGFDPGIVGPGAGGERGRTSAVNVQTNFLYINFRIPESALFIKVGQQLFSSPQGRVLFSTGTGVSILKSFQFLRLSWEGGILRARDQSFLDVDKNGFADKNYQNSNIFYNRMKIEYFRNIRNEVYAYWLDDNDKTDNETSRLGWYGLFNEFNFQTFSFSVHGILNTGTVKKFKELKDASDVTIYNTTNRHFIKGGLYDFQFTYRWSDSLNLNLIALGTTGRPGYNGNGEEANLKGNGYRTLAPGFSISNIATDFTGGYALFNGSSFSGINEYGTFANIIAFGPYQFTFGYYQLWATKSPEIKINREFSEWAGYKTSTYLGMEYNFNIRYNVTSDFQIVFRSGYFVAGDALFVLLDSKYGKVLREAFVTFEHRF
ncbi:hypothetical protein EHQ58_01500 [Leptospira ognonensis]|uniref:Alginate export domain-containing protein n=1 Tax=Leptospira ognonensis TaxID=2484945 RepID=A0A4R9KBB4_9LEPT|nr:hypothetical protein [Leptospira ognonensis]TGL63145.1 hypothetical protein EHQ58_01500 [Leptospira ognonensis]